MDREAAAAQVEMMAGDDIPRFKAIKDGKVVEFEDWFTDAWPRLQELGADGFNVYLFAQATREDVVSVKDSDVLGVRVIFADGDDTKFPKNDAWHATPTFTLFNEDTGRWWAFWCVSDCPLDELKNAQQRIAQHYKTDPSVSNPSRVVRLAGLPRWKEGHEYAAYDYEVGSGKVGKWHLHDQDLPKVKDDDRRQADDPGKINVRQDQPHNQRAFIAWLASKARTAGEGNRNNTLAATAAMGHSYALTPETTAELLWDHYNPRLDPPLEEEEFDKCVASGFRSATSRQGNCTEEFKQLRIKERAKLFEATITEGEQPDAQGRFKRYSYSGLEGRDDPQWLINQIIPELGYTILFGLPGTFKTFVALDMALCIATGRAWRDNAKVQQGRVLYCLGEGLFDVEQRIASWLEHNGVEKGEIEANFQVIEPAPMLKYPEDVQAFLEECERGGKWDLVVIDTIGRTMPGIDDHSGQGAREFSSLTTMISHRLKAATLALTHTRKDRGNVMLGSGAYEADSDVVLNMVGSGRQPTQVNLVQRKIKYGKPWTAAAMGLRREIVGESCVMVDCGSIKTMEDKEESGYLFWAEMFQGILKNRGTAKWWDIRAEMATKIAPTSGDGQEEIKTALTEWHSKWKKADTFFPHYFIGGKSKKNPIYRWQK